MKREMQVKELKVIDGTRRDFLQHQQRVKEAQIRRLDDQIKKRVSLILQNVIMFMQVYVCVCMCVCV